MNDKNVACLVKKVEWTACNHLIHDVDCIRRQQEKDGTSGMTTHIHQAERNFSALGHPIGDLRSNMLASNVERMVFFRLNMHLVVTRSTSWTPRMHRHELGYPRAHSNRRRLDIAM